MELQSEIKKSVDELLPIFGVTKLKPFQKDCIERILEGEKDLFCIQSTGSGKSFCYQLPALLLDGITIVVSPLKALIDDQLESLKAKGIRAVAFHSGIKAKREEFKEKLKSGKSDIKLIYTTPETLWYDKFFFSSLDVSMIVIDEAHCVSVWGQDFRPSYRCIRYFIEMFPSDKRPIIAAFTATADRTIFNEIVKTIGMNVTERDSVGTVKRNIDFPQNAPERQVFLFKDESKQINAICKFLVKNREEKILVFCRSINQLKSIKTELEAIIKKQGIIGLEIGEYHGGSVGESADIARELAYNLFSEGKRNIILSTSAFGMGVDISDIRYIIHVGFPYTMADYVQQCGRGGRNGEDCEYRLFASPLDVINTGHMLSLKYLKMYPMSEGVKIKKKNREEYIKVVEYCLEKSDCSNEKLLLKFITALEEYKNREFPEEQYIKNKSFQMLINTSEEMRNKARRKEISFYEMILADGIYSLWYNGVKSFTPRKLISCITGNEELSFHEEKRVYTSNQIDTLTHKIALPVVKETINGKTKYFFTERAINVIPGAFPEHEKALHNRHICNIPAGVLKIMNVNADSSSRKKKFDEYEEITEIKYYLLHELNRIFGYSDYHDKGHTGNYVYAKASGNTSKKITYVRYDKNAYAHYGQGTPKETKLAGMCSVIRFPYGIERLHAIVCSMLDNLKSNGYLCDHTTIYFSEKELKTAIKRGWISDAEVKDKLPCGVEIIPKK